jgi:hypothetical protein
MKFKSEAVLLQRSPATKRALRASNGRGSGYKQGDDLDEHLKHLMQQLGNAINESLSESENIAEVIGEIRKEGYDVFLVLEATIGFNRRDDEDDLAKAGSGVFKASEVSFTPQDHAFLKALKITIDE